MTDWHSKIYGRIREEEITEEHRALLHQFCKQFRSVCQSCKKKHLKRDLDLHHIVPRADGGTNEPENLILLCMNCHDLIEPLGFRDIRQIENYAISQGVKRIKRKEIIPDKALRWQQWVYGGYQNPAKNQVSA